MAAQGRGARLRVVLVRRAPVHPGAARRAAFPSSPDGVIPESYSHFVDPFVALARASGATSRIKLGTGIVLVPERHPLLLAKEVSTLDLFSGGRFLFGIGAGLAARGDRDHGRRLRPSLDADARVGAGHEGAVDEAGGRVPRQVLRLPAGAARIRSRRRSRTRRCSSGGGAKNVLQRVVGVGRRLAAEPRHAGRAARERAPRSTASPRTRGRDPAVASRSRCTASPPTATSSAASSTRAPRASSSGRPP